jgi:hypothetical protein
MIDTVSKKILMRAIHTCIFVAFAAAASLYGIEETYTVRVYYSHVTNVNALAKYDLHESGSAEEKFVRMTANDTICTQLDNDGWRYEIDAEATRAMHTAAFSFFGNYRTVDEIYEDCCAVTAAYPQITEIVEYGDAWCRSHGGDITPGNDTQKTYRLKAVRVRNTAMTKDAPVFFLMASLHGREITTPEIAMRMLDYLTQGYNVDADATWIVNEFDTWIVPVANPEGRWLAELGTLPPYNGYPFSQRKNAHSDGCTRWMPQPWSQYGVDLNRNHSFKWATVGSSSSPCDMTYHGASAASEPEIFHLQTLITNLFSDFRGSSITSVAPATTEGVLISLHSYGNLVLWPWGHTTTAAPNASELRMTGDRFAEYNGYTSQASSVLYLTGGDTVDWVYGELGVPAFTFEIGSVAEGFMPPFSVIDASQWPKNKDALIYAAKVCRNPYHTVYGPSIRDITSIDTTGSTVKISAVVDVGVRTNDVVADAEMYIGGLPWHTNALLYEMIPVDGLYDAQIETVTVAYTAGEFDPLRMQVYIRGQSTNGIWGPVSSSFIIVPEAEIFLPVCTVLLYVVRKKTRRKYL